MNLAPWKYRAITEKDGGPLARLSVREIPFHGGGARGCAFEAYAHLQDSLRPQWLSRPALYGSPDGTGTAPYRNQACHKAISEALERWAFYSAVDSPQSAEYGFHLESTTTGMAAFPDLPLPSGGRRRISPVARKIALREAIERWSVCAWWEGRVATRRLDPSLCPWKSWLETPDETGFGCAEISHPWSFGHPDPHALLLIWSSHGKSGKVAYGFACERTLERAFLRARAEQLRSFAALLKSPESDPRDIMEKRLVFFSGKAGFDRFLAKVERSTAQRQASLSVPFCLVDTEIPGPWSRYATVWRCLFQMPSREHLSDCTDYFML